MSDPTTQAQTAYYFSLGRFLDAYASVEVMLRILATQYSGLEWDVARVFFSGDRTDGLRDKINGMRAVRKLPRDPLLDSVFGQTTVIQKARNSILHYRTNQHQTAFVSSNRPFSKSIKSIYEIVVSPDILDCMYADLQKMQSCLMLHTIETFAPNVAELAPVVAAIKRIAQAPWQYKPTIPDAPDGQVQTMSIGPEIQLPSQE